MAIIATAANPSTTNIQGGIAGFVSTLVCGYLAHAGYFAIAATAIGQPEVVVAALAAGLIGMVAKVAVTHIAELKEADAFLVAVESVKTEASYLNDARPPTSTGQANSNINRG